MLTQIAALWRVGSSPTNYVCTNSDGEIGRHGYPINDEFLY